MGGWMGGTYRGGVNHDYPTQLLELLLGDPHVPSGEDGELVVEGLDDLGRDLGWVGG